MCTHACQSTIIIRAAGTHCTHRMAAMASSELGGPPADAEEEEDEACAPPPTTLAWDWEAILASGSLLCGGNVGGLLLGVRASSLYMVCDVPAAAASSDSSLCCGGSTRSDHAVRRGKSLPSQDHTNNDALLCFSVASLGFPIDALCDRSSRG